MNFEDYVLTHVEGSQLPINLAVAEKKYGATFVGDFCLKTVDGGWSESPAAVFWQPTPPVEGYSHYFGLVVRGSQIFITNGESAFSEPIVGIVSDEGEVIFSRYRHHYCTSKDDSVAIDGGRDYTKLVGNIHNQLVHIVPDGPKMKIIPMPQEV